MNNIPKQIVLTSLISARHNRAHFFNFKLNAMKKIDYCYKRVIPRDFFNESKLLKCIGRLCLFIHNRQTPIEMSFNEDLDIFEIGLMEEGALTVRYIDFKIKNNIFLFKTIYNSKNNYPFYIEHEYCDYLVFDENGEFDCEFLDFLQTLK